MEWNRRTYRGDLAVAPHNDPQELLRRRRRANVRALQADAAKRQRTRVADSCGGRTTPCRKPRSGVRWQRWRQDRTMSLVMI